MSFPAYQDYQDSAVEWLGEVPSHWTVERLTHLYREAIEPGEDHLPILSVSIHSGVSDGEASPDEGNRKITRSDDRTKYKKVLPGDLVYNMMRAWQGGFGAVQVPGMVSPAYIVARPRSDVSSRYVELLLRTPGAVEEMRRLSRGITDFRLRLYWDEFKSIRVAMPSATEREAILAFLDHETGKIDALIEEQRRLIALLKEKRQAVISHAVTKGRDPHAPMKGSGIEWLGEVPAHWNVMALRRLVDPARSITYGIVQPGEPDPQGRFMVRGQDYSRGWAIDEEIFRVSDAVEIPYRRARLQTGDVVITIVGAGTGNTAVVPPFLSGANITQTTARVAPLLNLIGGEYLATLMASRLGAVQVALYQKGAAQPGLNLEHLAAFRFPVPPQGEQAEIVERITPPLKQMQELTEAAEQAMALLSERRAALISAAVTGKIDVRGSAKVLPFPIDRTRARGLVGTEIIERSAGQPTFGRVKFQKVAFLAEGHVGISELAGSYTREAAGPLDRALIDEMERGAHSIAGIVSHQEGGTGTTVSYNLGQQRGAHRQELTDWLGADRIAKLDKLIADFADLTTKQAEAVATLYGVWNDALSEGALPTDDEIISGFLNDWHPEKREKFRASELLEWLGWMRRHGIVPTGSGPRTTTGRLFV